MMRLARERGEITRWAYLHIGSDSGPRLWVRFRLSLPWRSSTWEPVRLHIEVGANRYVTFEVVLGPTRFR